MATLQATNQPGSRVGAGDTVLERAKTVDTKPVEARLSAFRKAHAAYAKAEREVRAAEAAQFAQESKVAEADVAQDAAVDALASAMAGDGAPRVSPFKKLGKFGAPSDIKVMAYEKEATLCAALAKAALAWKPGTAKTKAAAKKLAGAAAAVKAALKPTHGLRKQKLAAIARRDGFGQTWSVAFEKLKNAARTAEDDGARGLFEALFRDDTPTAPRAKKKPVAPAVPVAAPPAPNGGPPPA